MMKLDMPTPPARIPATIGRWMLTVGAMLAFLAPPAPTTARAEPPVPPAIQPSQAAPQAGRAPCEIPASEYRARRAALQKTLANETAAIVVRAYFSDNEGIGPSRQDNDTVYLTGLDLLAPEVDAHLIVTGDREILAVPFTRDTPAFDAAVHRAKNIAGFAETDVVANADLDAALRAALAAVTRVYVQHDVLEENEVYGNRPRQEFRFPDLVAKIRAAAVGVNIPNRLRASASGRTWPLREDKSSGEIERIRAAMHITARAVRELMRHTKPGVREGDLRDIFKQRTRDMGATGLAFWSIVAGGRNTLELHYQPEGPADALPAGGLFLMDVGAEYLGYAADFSRTVPIDGQFTDAQLRHYEAVRGAQAACADALKPGASILHLHRRAAAEMARRMPGEAVEDHFWHLLGHFVGLHVHDPASFAVPLRPGHVITLEPGWYDPDTGDGVRIEDVFHVTEAGAELLSADEIAPRDPAAMVPLIGAAYRDWERRGLAVEICRAPAMAAGEEFVALRVTAANAEVAGSFAAWGVAVGDVLLSLDGQPIFGAEPALTGDPTGPLEILRDGMRRSLYPPLIGEGSSDTDFGRIEMARIYRDVLAFTSRAVAHRAPNSAPARAVGDYLSQQLKLAGASPLADDVAPRSPHPFRTSRRATDGRTVTEIRARVGEISGDARAPVVRLVVPYDTPTELFADDGREILAPDAALAVALEIARTWPAKGAALEICFVSMAPFAPIVPDESANAPGAHPALVVVQLAHISPGTDLPATMAVTGAPVHWLNAWRVAGHSFFESPVAPSMAVDAGSRAVWIEFSVPPPPAQDFRRWDLALDSPAPLAMRIAAIRGFLHGMAAGK